ncbi:hypothetical protein K438DRAFT_1979421 [Mycena galopus ATCC 62051]|nr:hypothetical protein K438DRAFT_1979421 [Mycena galopus ATCC 62051]
MGGTLYACSPGDPGGSDDLVHMIYSYTGFLEFKGIFLHATIAFLTALSAEQITKALLIEKGIIADAAVVEGVDESAIIANYRTRIDAAISLLQGWVNIPRPYVSQYPPPPAPAPRGYSTVAELLQATIQRTPAYQGMIALKEAEEELLATSPINHVVLSKVVAVPHTLVELRMAGIHTYCAMHDVDASVPYEQARDVARLLRMVKPYCIWDEERWPGEDPAQREAQKAERETRKAEREARKAKENETPKEEKERKGDAGDNGDDEVDEDEEDEWEWEEDEPFIDQMIKVFDAVPPGGRLIN